MGFDRVTIRNHRVRLGLPAQVRPPAAPPRVEPDGPLPPARANPVDVARLMLGARLEERPAGFFLDRVPVNLQTLMREANRIRAARGMPPLGPSHWHT